MSTRAKGADARIAKRLSVGMTEEEARLLGGRAQRAGLSLARYLVEAALWNRPYVTVGIPHDRLKDSTGWVKVRDVVVGPQRPPRLGDPKPPLARAGTAADNGGRRLALGEVVVWRCEGGRFKVATVRAHGLVTEGWYDGAEAADAAVERLLEERGR